MPIKLKKYPLLIVLFVTTFLVSCTTSNRIKNDKTFKTLVANSEPVGYNKMIIIGDGSSYDHFFFDKLSNLLTIELARRQICTEKEFLTGELSEKQSRLQ